MNNLKTHPMIYVLGDTEQYTFPLILTIGREPNDDGLLDESIQKINNEVLRSMRGGVWVTAYSQIAKIWSNLTASDFKSICFEKNISPIVFANAFPKAIRNEVSNKEKERNASIGEIGKHVSNIFNNRMADRYKVCIHHGVYDSPSSKAAAEIIKEKCESKGVVYFQTDFFCNINSKKIQEKLNSCESVVDAIRLVCDCFNEIDIS